MRSCQLLLTRPLDAFEVLASVKELIDCGINLFMQKEQMTLLDGDGKTSMIAPVMIAILSVLSYPLTYIINFSKNEDFSTVFDEVKKKCPNFAPSKEKIVFKVLFKF